MHAILERGGYGNRSPAGTRFTGVVDTVLEGAVRSHVMHHAADGHHQPIATLLTSNRPIEDWGKLLGDTAAVTALLDRLLHHAHVLKCGPRSWRTKVQTDLRTQDAVK